MTLESRTKKTKIQTMNTYTFLKGKKLLLVHVKNHVEQHMKFHLNFDENLVISSPTSEGCREHKG